LIEFAAILVGNSETMSASGFVDVIRREGTNILLADSGFEAHFTLEVLRTQAAEALQEFCDPIAASLEQFQQRSPGTAETPSGEQRP
jgi:hypothetical protein